jgi:hypothetical protein
MAVTVAALAAAGVATAGQKKETSVSYSTSVVVKVSGNASTNVTVGSKDGGVSVEVKASSSGNASASGHASGSASGFSSGSGSQNGGGQQAQQVQGGNIFPGNGGTRRGH